ncbi:MAG TPA: hypothetical protein VF175_08555, partial [Lacipirellula sp.]
MAAVTIAAIAVVAFQQNYRREVARNEFDLAHAMWDVGRERLAGVLGKEQDLYEVEIHSLGFQGVRPPEITSIDSR